MDADNPPMALPNGQVYSRQFIHSFATSQSGDTGKYMFTCPVTHLTVDVKQIRPVYIIS